ncbi:MAG: hypothetical protein QM783_11510 [Phycisphaerales bacterium]
MADKAKGDCVLWERWSKPAGVAVCATVVVVVAVSMFVPVGGRAGVILEPGRADVAWRMGMARGVLWYRREEPPIFQGQHLMWEPTLLGADSFGPWHRDISWWRITWEARSRPASVREAHVPVWPVALALVAWAAWVLRSWAVIAKRRRRGECRRCGYPRAGGACAECGWVEGG